MRRGLILPISLLVSFILTIVSAYLKITHSEGADSWLTAAFAVSLVFIVIGIYEVMQSDKIDRTEKLMWTIGFILLSFITGIIYLVYGRKRILGVGRGM